MKPGSSSKAHRLFPKSLNLEKGEEIQVKSKGQVVMDVALERDWRSGHKVYRQRK